METPAFVEDLQQRIAALLEGTPAADLQKNLKALLAQQFARLDLVTREEFEIQREVLATAREKIARLEAKVAEMEPPAPPR
jgi:BMFP domain-containing protein YqiC